MNAHSRSDDAQKIRDRIRKLRDRKVSRGCTGAEAMQAAEVAAGLMRDYGLSEDDIVMDRRHTRTRGGARTISARLWAEVALCTNTAATFVRDEDGRAIIIWIGREPGPQIADYLHDLLSHAINRAIAEFRKSAFYRRRRSAKTKTAAVQDFTLGLVSRLRRRLHDIFAQSISDDARDAAEAARDSAMPDAETVKPKQLAERYAEARDSGYAAGGRVGLHHGVGREDGPAGALTPPRLLLGRTR